VFVTLEKGALWLRSERSSQLTGPLLPLKENEFVAKWWNAVLLFELNQDGIPTRLTLKPLTAGSAAYYFGDLDFHRQESVGRPAKQVGP
jgi:hypothetical protein